MNERNPEWYDVMKTEPFARKNFTMEKIRRIEEHAANFTVAIPRKPHLARYLASAVAVMAAVAIGIGVYDGSIPYGQHLPAATNSAPPADIDNLHTYRLKGSVQALEQSLAYGSIAASFIADVNRTYEVTAQEGVFVKISSSDAKTGWIPEWYLREKENAADIVDVQPYQMIVAQPVLFSLFPQEPAPSGFELDKGKVVQVTGRYDKWLRVNIITYDSPYAGDKWVWESALAEWNPVNALEGLLRKGATVYDEHGKIIGEPPVGSPIRIAGVAADRYLISSAGGYSGYIDKVDFVPGPFSAGIVLSGQQIPDLDWIMQPAERQGYDQYANNRDEVLLIWLQPIEIFRSDSGPNRIRNDDPQQSVTGLEAVAANQEGRRGLSNLCRRSYGRHPYSRREQGISSPG